MHVGDLWRHVDQAGQPGELLVQRRYDVVARWRGGGGVGGRDAGDALLDALDQGILYIGIGEYISLHGIL